MACKVILKNLHDRPFNAIKQGRKTIEVRANKNELSENSVNTIERGDIIIFTNTQTNETIQCTIERKTLYASVRDLLESEGTANTLSSTRDIEEGIKSIESIENYKELISKNGVFALELRDVKVL